MDIGCTSANFRLLKEIAKEMNASDKVFVFKDYLDEDYGIPGFSFMMRDDETVLCDICEYKEVADRLVCAIPEWRYPDYMRDDVLPPRRVMMLANVSYRLSPPNAASPTVGTRRPRCRGSRQTAAVRSRGA